jgi:chromosome segregation ATPase
MEQQIAKLQNWLNELATLKTEINANTSKLELSKKENDNLLEQIFQLKSIIGSKDELIEVLQNQKSVINAENAELLTQQNELNAQIETLSAIDTTELDNLKLEHENVSETNQQLSLEIEMLQNSVTVLKADKLEFENTKKEWETTFANNTNLKFELDQKSLEIESQKTSAEEWITTIAEKDNTIALLEKSIENLGSQLSQYIQKGEIALALQNQNTLLQSEIELLKTQIESNTELSNQVDSLTAKNIQLAAVTNDLVREKMETQWEITELKNKEAEYNKVDGTIKETISGLNQKLDNSIQENQKLIEEVAFTKNFINVIENQNKELLDTVNSLNLNNSILKEQLTKWEGKEVFDAEGIEQLQNQLAESKHEILNWEGKAFEAQRAKENLEEEITMLKQQFSELEDSMSAVKNSQSNLANHRTNLFSQNEIVEKDYESEMAMQVEYDQLQENYMNLNEKFNNQLEKQKHLESMNNSLKLAKNTTSDTEDTGVLKERINQLVGEIDKCIDLLSNNE